LSVAVGIRLGRSRQRLLPDRFGPVHFLQTDKDNLAVFKSKAVGEPPLMYGIGAFFALRNAIKAFNPYADVKFDAPMTAEKVLMNLYSPSPKESKKLVKKEISSHE